MASSTSALMIRNFYWDRFYKVLCNDLLKKKMTIYMFLVKLEIIKLLTLLLGHGEIVRKGVSVRLNFQTTSSDTWHSILFYWPTVSLSVVDTKTKKWTAHMRENYKGQRFLHFLIMTLTHIYDKYTISRAACRIVKFTKAYKNMYMYIKFTAYKSKHWILAISA